MRYLLSLTIWLAVSSTAMASKNFADEIANLGDVAAFDFTNEVTMSIKLYRRANSPASQGLIAKGRTDLAQPMLYGLYFNNNILKFVYANPDGVYFTFSSTGTFPQTNTAIHIAAKYQYSIAASMKLFVNGENVAGTWDISPVTVGLVNANGFQIGILNTAAQGISGRVTDVAIWNAYLTDQQIALLYHGPKRTATQFPTGLIASWAFDNGRENDTVNAEFRLIDDSPFHANSFANGGSGAIKSDAFTGYQPNE
jgi:concanavalin A-like lectin/glucanase superfamily protein